MERLAMSLVRWDDKYIVGNEVIDRDHKALFVLINDFYDAFQESNRRRDIGLVLMALVKYAEQHFRREEAIMAVNGYPAKDDHHEFHTKLYESIYQINERLASDPAPLDRQTIAFLKDWLSDHILVEDLKFSEFLRQRQGSQQ
jgi:hemerythrin